jgi:hypothetical protein
MLIEAVIVGTLVGLVIRRGQLEWLTKINFKHLYLPVIAMMFEFAGSILLEQGFTQINPWLIELLVYSILFAFVWLNANQNVMLIIMMGIALNALVIFANDGMMPVDVSKALDYGYDQKVSELSEGHVFAHQVMTDTTAFKGLADVYHLFPPYPLPKSFSVGDLLISAGVLILLITSSVDERSDICT